MSRTSCLVRVQAGVMLLEALIAVLIFSLGILSLVALQATSIQLASDAKYRVDASLLADKLIGQMWASGGTAENLEASFASPDGGAYQAWRDGDVKASNSLPGIMADEDPDKSTLPIVTVNSLATAGASAATVEITIFWRTPQMKPDDRHRHVVTSQIVFPNP
jgi:type IV pilus assembly protein PilV